MCLLDKSGQERNVRHGQEFNRIERFGVSSVCCCFNVIVFQVELSSTSFLLFICPILDVPKKQRAIACDTLHDNRIPVSYCV